MKKISAILVIIVITLLVGCGVQKEERKVSQEAQTLGYFTFPKTEWGMSSESLLKELNKKADDFSVNHKTSDVENTTTYSGKYDFMDEKIDITFLFANAPLTESETLREASWTYSKDFDQKQFDTLCKKIKDEICYPDIKVSEPEVVVQKVVIDSQTGERVAVRDEDTSVTDKAVGEYQTYVVKSNATTETLPKGMKESFNKFIVHLYDKGLYPNPPSHYKEIDYTKSYQQPFSILKLTFDKDNDTGKGKVTVLIDGNGIATAKAYVDGFKALS